MILSYPRWRAKMSEIILKSEIEVSMQQFVGGDESIIAAARVSTAGYDSLRYLEEDPERGKGLINFLMKNRHGTPFEHASITFLISAPIFVFREFHRHRIGWSYNEESGRYKQLSPVFWVPGKDRKLCQEGKPGHYVYVEGTEKQYDRLIASLQWSYLQSYTSYEASLEEGIAKEVARVCLPVAIYSSMWATCNPRSLMAFLSLRTKDDRAMFPSSPMNEINECATKMEEDFARLFPITYEAYNRNGRVAP